MFTDRYYVNFINLTLMFNLKDFLIRDTFVVKGMNVKYKINLFY